MGQFHYEFNLENFGLGVLAGWGTAYALYRARHIINRARSSVSRQASSAQEFASRNADSRYINDLIKYCERAHLAGDMIELSSIVIEPRFVPAPDLAAPREDDVIRSVFHVVPNVHDHPYLHAPYNIETLTIDELDNGDRAIALLGHPGSGRTTTLHTIALWSLGRIRFDPPPDIIQQRLEEEEAAIENREERAQRAQERYQIEQIAIETLARKRGEQTPTESEQRAPGYTLLKHLTPVYVHFGNIIVESREYGRSVDPAEPLVRAAQQYVSRITSKTLPPNLYNRLNEGKVLLLLDGFDDIPQNERTSKLAWLRAYLEIYGQNFTIVTGPATGYSPLTQAGLVPVFLRPWHDVSSNQLADNWAANWQKVGGGRRGGDIDPITIERAKQRNRARTPFEITIKLWTQYLTQDVSNLVDWMHTLLSHYLQDDSVEKALPMLQKAAVLQIEEGYITPRRLDAVLYDRQATAAPDPVDDPAHIQSVGPIDEDLDELLDSIERDVVDNDNPANQETSDTFEVADTITDDELSPDDTETSGDGNTIKTTMKFITRLQKRGLLVHYRGGRYQFRHPLITAYLGSLFLATLDQESIADIAFEPAWQPVLPYLVAHSPVEEIVQMRLHAANDILQSYVLETARWLAYASGSVAWRSPLLKQLGNMFVAPMQYPQIRERVTAALIGTRDPNTLVIFRKALKHPNHEVRRLACLGLGALRAEDAINDLTTLLQDDNADVTLAAGLALGAIGTDDALEEMVVALTGGSENLRQAVAEAFAAIPEEGYPVLYDAIHHEDYMLRRAAVFGLRRIKTRWALIELYRTSIEDTQWYVRAAAEQAFVDIRLGDQAIGPQAYPEPESIPWLRSWLHSLGDGAVREHETGDELLRKALEEGEPDIQLLSARNIGQMGKAQYAGLLYSALRHRNDEVREAAFRALSDLQIQLGEPLPSPV